MKRFILLLSSLLMFGLASAQDASTLVFCQSGLPVTLDTGQDGNSLTPAYQVLEPLVFFEPGTGNTAPGLATDWSANEDSTVWTFTLRDDVTFQDGTPFNAEAVKFNLDRWNDPANEYRFDKPFVPWTWIFGGFLGEGSVLESVDVVDETTVRLNLNEAVSFVPAMLASSYFGMHSPTAVQEGGADYGTPNGTIVGTGPFQFDEWTDGSQVALSAFENYWGDAPGVDSVVFLGIEDPTARLAQLKSGSCDIAVNLSSDDFEQVENDDTIEPAMVDANLNVGYLAFHQDNEPFGDERVRQAIAYAIDQQAIVDAFYAGLGQVASQFVPPALWGRDEGLEAYPYDPERARELLAEAGYPDGFSTELWYMPVSRPLLPRARGHRHRDGNLSGRCRHRGRTLDRRLGHLLRRLRRRQVPHVHARLERGLRRPRQLLVHLLRPQRGRRDRLDRRAAGRGLEPAQRRARRASTQEERQAIYEQVDAIISQTVVQLPVAHNRVLKRRPRRR